MKINNLTIISIISLLFAVLILGYSYTNKNKPEEKKNTKIEFSKIINIKKQPQELEVNTTQNTSNQSTDTKNEYKIEYIPQPQTSNTQSRNTVYQIKDEKDFKYQNHVLYSILKKWYLIKKDTNADFAMLIRIDKDGKIISYGILRESSNKDFQSKAIKTVIESVPYKKFTLINGNYITYQIVFRGNDVRIGTYKTSYELPYKVNYKKISKEPYDFEDTKVCRTVGSAPGKLAYKMPDSMPILRNWAPPLDVNSKVNLEFDISKEGKAINIKTVSSTASKQALQAAYNALNLAQFEGVSEPMQGIKFWFEVVNSPW